MWESTVDAVVGLAGLSPQQDVDLLLDPILEEGIDQIQSWLKGGHNALLHSSRVNTTSQAGNNWSPYCRGHMCWWTSDTPDRRDPQAEWDTIGILF